MENTFFPPYTPELNGITQRVNRTLVEATRAYLSDPSSPFAYGYFCLSMLVMYVIECRTLP